MARGVDGVIVAIHQPNFFPYEGVLSKIAACDRFVILAHCQYERGNYHNRFRLNDHWFTMPVSQALEPLVAKQYIDPRANWERIRRRLPESFQPAFSRFDDCVTGSLVETNVTIIRWLCTVLGIGTEIVMDYPTALRATDRLVDLCRHYGATTYLSGPSGPQYMDMGAFERAGLRVAVQESKPEHRRAALELVIEEARQ